MQTTRPSRFALTTAVAVATLCHGSVAAIAQPVDSLYDGCTEVMSGPRCALPANGTLTVWLDVRDPADLVWDIGGTIVEPAAARAAADGVRLHFTAVMGTGTLRAVDQYGTERFTLELSSSPPTPILDTANHDMAAGRYAKALSLLDAELARATPNQTAALLRARARVHNRRGDRAKSHRDYRAAIAAAAAAGQQHTGALSALALEYSLRHEDGDLDAARQALAPFELSAGGHASDRYFLLYHTGMIEYRAGNVRRHLTSMREAARIADRFDWPRRALRAQTRLAVQWQDLGRRDKARELLTDWRDRLPDSLPGCEQAFFWTNLGWAHLLELEAGEPSIDPLPVLKRASDLSDQHCGLTDRINARVNLGLAHWYAGRTEDADKALDAARQLSSSPPAHIALWSLDLTARIALTRGQTEKALERYDELALRARTANLPATRWRALVRRGWVLETSGRLSAALDAYNQAQDALDSEVLRVPIHEGRETLLATRRFASLQQLDLLLDAGDRQGALNLVVRDRARALRLAHVAAQLEQLDGEQRQRWDHAVALYRAQRDRLSQQQAQSWTLSGDALAELRLQATRDSARMDRELDLALSDLNQATAGDMSTNAVTAGHLVAFTPTASGWAVLIERADQVAAVRPTCTQEGDVELAACLVRAATIELNDLSDVRLLVDDTLADVAWQALPLGDAQWIDKATIRFAAALPATARATPAPGNAVLVGDPTGNLRAARVEVTRLRQRLREAKGWASQTLTGEQAISATVRTVLPGAALFHYAGHASFGDALGWDSVLELGADTSFGIGDILMLEGAPQLVVLSGCETARRPGLRTPTMGLANAFLAAGASAVIATTRSVDDASAGALTTAFYDHWLAGAQIADALRAAQREIRDRQPQLDWSAFRLIQP